MSDSRDKDGPTKSAASTKPFRDHWILLGIVATALIVMLVMEHRHAQVREIESWGYKHRGISFSWTWDKDSDPMFYGTCVGIEDRLRGRSAPEQWLARNIERVRRRLRSNFSPIEEVALYDMSYDLLTKDDDYALVQRAIDLAQTRGAEKLDWFIHDLAGDPDDERFPELSDVAQREGLVGERARGLIRFSEDMIVD